MLFKAFCIVLEINLDSLKSYLIINQNGIMLRTRIRFEVLMFPVSHAIHKFELKDPEYRKEKGTSILIDRH